MSEPGKEVRVKLKKGAWEVEIVCSEDQIKGAIESVLAGLDTQRSERAELGIPRIKRGAVTCRTLIQDLWREGFFATERSLSDVHEELARRGYHYDRTAVSHSLTDLVRENALTRTGESRTYRYVQKRPP